MVVKSGATTDNQMARTINGGWQTIQWRSCGRRHDGVKGVECEMILYKYLLEEIVAEAGRKGRACREEKDCSASMTRGTL